MTSTYYWKKRWNVKPKFEKSKEENVQTLRLAFIKENKHSKVFHVRPCVFTVGPDENIHPKVHVYAYIVLTSVNPDSRALI